jgi:hypothetical protein
MISKETQLRSLALIKYVHQLGVAQSKKPAPFSAIALLHLHDSVEWFLRLACESKGVTVPKDFMSYWDALDKAGAAVTMKPSMEKLNRARVDFKHYGLQPSDIDEFRSLTRAFLEENTHSLFGIEYATVSLIDLIEDEEVHGLLKKGIALFAEGKREISSEKIAVAHSLLGRLHQKRLDTAFGHSVLPFGNRFSDAFRDPQQRQVVAGIIELLKSMVCGFDYHEFARFHFLTPLVLWTESGQSTTQWLSGICRPISSEDELQFCIEFVVQYAARLQNTAFPEPMSETTRGGDVD